MQRDKRIILNLVCLLLVAGLFFSLPISTASTNIFFISLFLISVGHFLQDAIFKKNFIYDLFSMSEVASFLGFFFFIFVISLMVSKNYGQTLHGISKYFEILTVPFIALYIYKSKLNRQKAVLAFSLAMILTLILSYAIYFDVTFLKLYFIKDNFARMGLANNPTVFKLHITQNFFMAMAVLVWGAGFFQNYSINKWSSLFYLVMCLLGLFNVFFMVQGRTGYLVILVAMIYFMLDKYKYRGLMYASLLFGLAVVLMTYVPSTLQSRLNQGLNEILFWNSSQASATSMGMRLEFISNSIGLAVNNLFWGTGVGSFPEVYSNFIAGKGMVESSNPHNQYMLYLVEIGLFGLVGFIGFNYICWRMSMQLSTFWKHATRIVLLSYGVANIFNSFLFDFAESLFFSVFMALAFSELLSKKDCRHSANLV